MATLTQSQYLATTTTSAKFTNAMADGVQYRLCVSTDSWVTVGLTGGSADAAAGSHLVKAGQAIGLTKPRDVALSGFVHVEALADAGHATLSVVKG